MTSPFSAGRALAPGSTRPARVAIVVPAVVFVLTALLVAWSAWPTVRPVRRVRVTQAIFERGSEPPGVGEPIVEVPTVQAAGWLEAEPYLTAVAALADGVVETVPVLEGDFVEQGQVVATLVDEDARLGLGRASAELARAEAAVRLAEAELEAARTDWERPVELERRLALSQATLAEAEAELARLPALIDAARATLVRHEEESRRTEQASDRQAATDLEVVIARQRAAAQRAEVAGLEAHGAVLGARIAQARSETEAAAETLELRVADRLRLASARAALALAQAERDRASVARDEAALERERMTVRAPVSGYVQRRLKVPGDKAVRMMDDPASAQIVHLYDPARLQVRVDVPLADASHVSVGQACEVVVEVLPDTVFSGRVLRITHEADLQKNTLQVKVGIESPSPVLRPEMLTRVRFLGSGRGAGAVGGGVGVAPRVRVPPATIDVASGAERVWVISERRALRGRARPIPISVDGRGDGWVTVTGAVRPGDLLITDPSGLRPDQPVAIGGDAGAASEEAPS